MQLKENLPCQNLVEVDKTSTAQVAALRKELEEKSEALQDLDRDYNCLIVKLNLTNQELQDARKESINVSMFLFSLLHCFVFSVHESLFKIRYNPQGAQWKISWFLMCRV